MTTQFIHHTASLDWVPLAPGLSFKPIAFLDGYTGYQLLLRVEPGTVIPRHRHTGEIHAFVLSGQRRIVGVDQVIGPGDYVHEPIGNVDSWHTVGNEPCIIHIEANGRIEYLDADDNVIRHTDAVTARDTYLEWCTQRGLTPEVVLIAASAA